MAIECLLNKVLRTWTKPLRHVCPRPAARVWTWHLESNVHPPDANLVCKWRWFDPGAEWQVCLLLQEITYQSWKRTDIGKYQPLGAEQSGILTQMLRAWRNWLRVIMKTYFKYISSLSCTCQSNMLRSVCHSCFWGSFAHAAWPARYGSPFWTGYMACVSQTSASYGNNPESTWNVNKETRWCLAYVQKGYLCCIYHQRAAKWRSGSRTASSSSTQSTNTISNLSEGWQHASRKAGERI